MKKKSVEHESPYYLWVYEDVDKDICQQISKKHNLPPVLAEVLIKRGIVSDSDIEDYFKTPLNTLINPFMMKDMKRGVERICRAIKNKERICIYGDYDVDGVTSTSLLYQFLRELKAEVIHYIPNRLEEGYGLNIEAVEELAKKNVNLIITVDCGISAVNEVQRANELGMDVVITDHHQLAGTIPEAYAVINPMRPDDDYPFKHLSGVGVAFKLCIAIRHTLRKDPSWSLELPNLKQYLDIVTLGTIADVVPLNGENRTFVIHGLKILAGNKCRAGIDELKKVSGLYKQKLSASHVGFGLAPRINAVGRLGDSDRGFRLLTTSDRNEARYLASELDQENKFRQDIEKEILTEVFKTIEQNNLPDKYSGFVLYSNDWHPGVLGIVASRVADKYYRPTIILTEENGQLKGSARSIPGFHLYDGLKELEDLLISFGGHKYAAGLKIDLKDIGLLQDRFDKLVKSKLEPKDYMPKIVIDTFLSPKDINMQFMELLSSFEPYGNSNKEPVFCMKKVQKYQEPTYVGKDSAHLKCYFAKDEHIFDCIGYDLKNYEGLLRDNECFDIIFTLSYNNYGRSKSVQFILKDLRVSENASGC